MNQIMQRALRVLSQREPDIKKTYRLERRLSKSGLADSRFAKRLYSFWDHKIYAGTHSIPVRIFSPIKEKVLPGQFPVLLFFHGGGFVKGDINSYSKVCSNLAKMTKHAVISVDYRLAPEYKFPVAAEDCYRVAEELFTRTELLQVSPDHITLIGDSAGGNLAAAVSLMARDRGVFLPKKQILLYPTTYHDHSPCSPFASIRENGTDYLLTAKRICDYLELYIDKPADYLNPYFAPLLSENFSRQPDTLIITAEFDPLRDEGEAYGEQLKAAGNRVEVHRIEEALHGFFTLPPQMEQVKNCYGFINDFLGE